MTGTYDRLLSKYLTKALLASALEVDSPNQKWGRGE